MSSSSSSTLTPRPSMRWSRLCTLIFILVGALLLQSVTEAALTPGFCPDCQTFSYAMAPCGTFGPSDIAIDGVYELQESQAKCACTEVLQRVLWNCAKCNFLAGHQSKSWPPQKYQTQCLDWKISIDQWRSPYTGQVAPGTQADLGGGSPPPSTSSTPTKPTSSSSSSSGSDGGKPTNTDKDNDKSTSTDSISPTSSSDNSSSGGNTETTSGPNSKVIGITVGIIGVAIIAGVIATVTLKRRNRRRRRSILDLSAPPALAELVASGRDEPRQWEKPRPGSPSGPVASAPPPVHTRPGGPVAPYDGRGPYMAEGSVVGGYDGHYDGQYDQYDQQYGHYHGSNAGYDDYGQHGYGNGGYQYHQYGDGYDQGYHRGAPSQGYDYGYDQTPSLGPSKKAPSAPHA
ncbi:hypothetical protein BGW38_007766 [Lunasporangiospora selenospora]|uniref:Transmembrane protein n=1 Tax=Lunasporangiospora selenospora TaxID=979761 RepID=A0A9P6FYA1_9FUNG|nr:hypothetical protein BGW38_007766 [Lunasporangiospora selenospora]